MTSELPVCADNPPCQNGMSCYQDADLPLGYYCDCLFGYSGALCEIGESWGAGKAGGRGGGGWGSGCAGEAVGAEEAVVEGAGEAGVWGVGEAGGRVAGHARVGGTTISAYTVRLQLHSLFDTAPKYCKTQLSYNYVCVSRVNIKNITLLRMTNRVAATASGISDFAITEIPGCDFMSLAGRRVDRYS